MATTVTTITNVSTQVVPILINEIESSKASSASSVDASIAHQMQIAPGSQVTIEKLRIDIGQLERLRTLKLITFTN